MSNFKHWQLDTADGTVTLTLNHADRSQNVLSQAVILELEQALDQADSLISKALIIKSGKENNFIAGADISEFGQIKTAEEASILLKKAHGVFNRIEAIPYPTVAQINGLALGGGLELALACRYRVALDNTNCRLGLPEIKLGIHPGFGGTVRLTERVGIIAAMGLMLTGRTVAPKQAYKMGFIDLVVPARQLNRATSYLIDKQPPPRQIKAWMKLLQFNPVRYLIASYLKKQITKKVTPQHYPAPFALIDLWHKYGNNRTHMLKAEQDSIAQLIQSSTSHNLTRVFFLQEGLKKIGKVQNSKTLSHLHVVGAGVMGGDIAAWAALQGLIVTIEDQNHEALAHVNQRAYKLFKNKLRNPRLVQAAMDRFQPDIEGNGAHHADIVLEAIVENVEAKVSLFSKLQQITRENAILATNTSSIPLETISHALKKPGRLVGLHFFNPVAKMQLVEVVRGEKTFVKVSNQAAAFVKQINRLPVMVASSPGFLVNRILMPYLLEAVELLKEGVPAPVIDKAAINFGMPMGPVTLADNVGLDICYHVASNLTEHYGGKVPALLKQKFENGHLGIKTGYGFYHWHHGKIQKVTTDKHYSAPPDITDRMFVRYLNEAVACLHEGIVDNSDHLDASLIFGTGFAPFRGGPINYIKHHGLQAMEDKLKALQDKYGERFKPSEGWASIDLEKQ